MKNAELDANIPIAKSSRRPGRGTSPPDRADTRLQRIIDYSEEALAKSDALEANLGSVITDLLLIARRYSLELKEVLNTDPSAPEELELIEPSLDQYLRVTKQLDRFTQLVVKLERAPKED
jgi:hypothetical protein